MAENPPASVKEKLKKSREREKECAGNLHQRQRDLLDAKTAAIDLELAGVSKDLDNVHVHFHSERDALISGYIGSLIRKDCEKASEKPVTKPDAPKFYTGFVKLELQENQVETFEG
ncbi:hypothetical protein OUZ56_029786 [Daphnia magna]|uniref:Uncharacterized protein n=1 Tax=Daphnia magna TaxID=35525 RepID=A0ABR0B897_9CRUS|nr:hypothetical protein OUZ56_029786 [Daphnia magna]